MLKIDIADRLQEKATKILLVNNLFKLYCHAARKPCRELEGSNDPILYVLSISPEIIIQFFLDGITVDKLETDQLRLKFLKDYLTRNRYALTIKPNLGFCIYTSSGKQEFFASKSVIDLLEGEYNITGQIEFEVQEVGSARPESPQSFELSTASFFHSSRRHSNSGLSISGEVIVRGVKQACPDADQMEVDQPSARGQKRGHDSSSIGDEDEDDQEGSSKKVGQPAKRLRAGADLSS